MTKQILAILWGALMWCLITGGMLFLLGAFNGRPKPEPQPHIMHEWKILDSNGKLVCTSITANYKTINCQDHPND